jgi:hypothetical protein
VNGPPLPVQADVPDVPCLPLQPVAIVGYYCKGQLDPENPGLCERVNMENREGPPPEEGPIRWDQDAGEFHVYVPSGSHAHEDIWLAICHLIGDG